MAFSPDKRLLATGGNKKQLKMIDFILSYIGFNFKVFNMFLCMI
jgi:hypothetical protein